MDRAIVPTTTAVVDDHEMDIRVLVEAAADGAVLTMQQHQRLADAIMVPGDLLPPQARLLRLLTAQTDRTRYLRGARSDYILNRQTATDREDQFQTAICDTIAALKRHGVVIDAAISTPAELVAAIGPHVRLFWQIFARRGNDVLRKNHRRPALTSVTTFPDQSGDDPISRGPADAVDEAFIEVMSRMEDFLAARGAFDKIETIDDPEFVADVKRFIEIRRVAETPGMRVPVTLRNQVRRMREKWNLPFMLDDRDEVTIETEAQPTTPVLARRRRRRSETIALALSYADAMVEADARVLAYIASVRRYDQETQADHDESKVLATT